MIRQDVIEKQTKEAAKIEAEQERRKYLERRLETIKQETIAAELAESEAKQHDTSTRKISRRTAKATPEVYTWINEKGQVIHSNKPRKENR